MSYNNHHTSAIIALGQVYYQVGDIFLQSAQSAFIYCRKIRVQLKAWIRIVQSPSRAIR